MSAEVIQLVDQPRQQMVAFNQQEVEAMFGLGPAALSLYFWLRVWMDYATGRVGITRPISYEMMRTYLEEHTERGRGVQRDKGLSLDQVRRRIARLEGRGLVRRLGTEHLVFSMPLAMTKQVREFQTRRSSATVAATPTTSIGAGLQGDVGRGAEPYPPHIRDHGLLSTSPPATTACTSGRRDDEPPVVAAAIEEDEPEMSQQDLRAGVFGMLLKQHDIRVRDGEASKAARWAERGLTEAQVKQAIGKAKALRQSQASTAAIPINLIDALLRDANPPRSSRRDAGQSQKQPAGIQGWRSDSASIRRKARELGMTEQLVADGNKQRMETIHELAERVAQRLQEGGA